MIHAYKKSDTHRHGEEQGECKTERDRLTVHLQVRSRGKQTVRLKYVSIFSFWKTFKYSTRSKGQPAQLCVTQQMCYPTVGLPTPVPWIITLYMCETLLPSTIMIAKFPLTSVCSIGQIFSRNRRKHLTDYNENILQQQKSLV